MNMYPKGIIYEKGISKKRGVIILKAPLGVQLAFTGLRLVGSGLVGFAVMAFIFSFGPIIKEEVAYFLRRPSDPVVNSIQANKEEEVRREAQELGLDSYYSIYIPKLEAKSGIVANVDAANRTEYLEALQQGVAHTKGTYFPGQGKLVYMFAHSTDSPLDFSRYNAVFYLLNKLEKGDRIVVYFADGRYEYEVTEEVVVKGSDTSWLTRDYPEETLVLQTCDPPGTTLNRLLIVAKPV